MKTTCVDEERIQRVDSTYLYLQQKIIKKMLRKSQFIHPSYKENSARLCLSVPISVKNTQGCCHPHRKKNDSSLNLFLKNIIFNLFSKKNGKQDSDYFGA